MREKNFIIRIRCVLSVVPDEERSRCMKAGFYYDILALLFVLLQAVSRFGFVGLVRCRGSFIFFNMNQCLNRKHNKPVPGGMGKVGFTSRSCYPALRGPRLTGTRQETSTWRRCERQIIISRRPFFDDPFRPDQAA